VREEADRERIRRLMEAFGRAAGGNVRVYLGGRGCIRAGRPGHEIGLRGSK
jgi:hypothetical protein